MDPNATLQEMRRIVARLAASTGRPPGRWGYLGNAERQQLGERLAELVEALDTWISRGGFLPGAWKGGQR